MSAPAVGWQSKCPYNFGGDAEACDPCPQCDADKPQSPLAASNDAEVGHGVAELQQADWHIPGPCGPENWEQRAVRRVAEVKGDPPKPPLCWICGKSLPHDCVGGTPTLVASAFDLYCTTVDATGYEMRTRHAFEAGWYADKQAHKAQVFGMLGGYQAKIASDAQALAVPKIDLKLPDNDTREPKVRWSEWSADRKSLSVCISVTHGLPGNPEVAAVSSIVQSWLDKQGHERCWYYPELFNQLAAALRLKATVAPGLPLQAEFVEGCKRYQVEQYSKSLAPITHGPPQGPQATAANSFAHTSRKWPIGTSDENLFSDSDDHWSERLKEARHHIGLTLDALGARLNPLRTRKDISAMEHGRRGLSVELCAELAQALDCDRCWLAGWKEGT